MRLKVLRWFLFFLIALAEILWLAFRIDAPPSGLLSYTRGIPSIFIIAIGVFTLFGWGRSYVRMLDQPTCGTSWPILLAHFGSFIVFSWLTIYVFEAHLQSLQFFWIVTWAATGLATALLWCLALLPAKIWIRLIHQSWSIILAGCIVGVMFWVLVFLVNWAWEPLGVLLGRPTIIAVQLLLGAFGQDVVCQPPLLVVGVKQFIVQIGPGCSGYEGIGLILVFVNIYLFLFRGWLRFPQALILLPCGILLIWFLNAVRIASLIIVGTHLSPEIAMGGFHSQTGWLGFIAVALAMVAVTQRMPFFTVTQSNLKAKIEDDKKGNVETFVKADIEDKPKAKTEEKTKEINPTAAYLGPLMAELAVTMVTGMLSSRFDWLYPARVLGTAIAIWAFWRNRNKPSTEEGQQFSNIATWQLRKITRRWSEEAVGIGVAVFGLWVGLEWATDNSGSGFSIPKSLGEMPGGLVAAWLLFRVLGSVITAPIAEELAFRGFLLRRLISADFDQMTSVRFAWLSFLASSVLYGALHGRWLAGTVAGMFYAWAMYRRGRVGDAIIAHATTNALIAAEVLVFGHYFLWE